MNEIQMYMILNRYKNKLNKQQYKTIKGQIKSGDYIGAKKGIVKIVKG